MILKFETIHKTNYVLHYSMIVNEAVCDEYDFVYLVFPKMGEYEYAYKYLECYSQIQIRIWIFIKH